MRSVPERAIDRVAAQALRVAMLVDGRRRLSVLIYHRVLREADPLQPETPTGMEFEARMRWIKQVFDVLPLSAALQALRQDRLPPRALCITFDDGYADNHDVALPILEKLGLTATFFIATGYLDGGRMFNDTVIEAVRRAPGPVMDLQAIGLGSMPIESMIQRREAIARILEHVKYFSLDRREDAAQGLAADFVEQLPRDLMMTSSQVAAMHDAGVEIGAHTVSHPILASVDHGVAEREISAGRERLEEIVKAPVRLFAYPNGRPRRDFGAEHVRLVRKLGFDAAVTTAPGVAYSNGDFYQIPRFTPWDRSNLGFGLRLMANARYSHPEIIKV